MRSIPLARSLPGLLAGLSLVVAACGGGGTATPAATAVPAPTPAPSLESQAAPEAGAASIALGETSLGTVLVDSEGRTLYMFTADTNGTSTCYDACADNWPPVLGTAEAGAGLDAAMFGTTMRTDGATQVTFNGMPLYLFAGDTAAGDVNGQGVGEKWYVLGADGKPIE